MFEIYTKEVEIKSPSGELIKYKLRPLNGRHISKVFDIVRAISKQKVDASLSEEEQSRLALESFTEDMVNKLHIITFETLKSSYPKEDEEELNIFASQNLLQFMDAIVTINMPNDA